MKTAEQDKAKEMEEELIYLPHEIFLDAQERLRDSRTAKIEMEKKREDMLIKLQVSDCT